MGQKLERRAIQLGLRGEILQNYSRDWIIQIEDITEFVQQQRSNRESNKWINLITPTENVYPVDNSEIIVDKNIVKYDIFLFCKFYLDARVSVCVAFRRKAPPKEALQHHASCVTVGRPAKRTGSSIP